MELKALTLYHFRNYTHATISFAPGINVIQGCNGSGKTNLMEAIYLLTTGRSFRTPHLLDLIQKGHSSFHLEATFEKEGVSQTLSFSFNGTQRTIKHNSSRQHTVSNLLGLFPSVLYAPKDSALIMGTPTDRRRFLNIQLAQSQSLYSYHLVRYHKALKQRNVLLKTKQCETIESWERVMAKSGSYLIEERRKLIDRLSPKATDYSAKLLLGNAPFKLHYQPSISLKTEAQETPISQIIERLSKERFKEMHLGMTLLGPHRDDMLISYDARNAKVYASEGQKRICIAALKLAEWDLLSDVMMCRPLFMIDDFAVHLDAKRSERVHKQVSHCGQILLTTPHFLLPDAHHLTILDGTLVSHSI